MFDISCKQQLDQTLCIGVHPQLEFSFLLINAKIKLAFFFDHNAPCNNVNIFINSLSGYFFFSAKLVIASINRLFSIRMF